MIRTKIAKNSSSQSKMLINPNVIDCGMESERKKISGYKLLNVMLDPKMKTLYRNLYNQELEDIERVVKFLEMKFK